MKQLQDMEEKVRETIREVSVICQNTEAARQWMMSLLSSVLGETRDEDGPCSNDFMKNLEYCPPASPSEDSIALDQETLPDTQGPNTPSSAPQVCEDRGKIDSFNINDIELPGNADGIQILDEYYDRPQVADQSPYPSENPISAYCQGVAEDEDGPHPEPPDPSPHVRASAFLTTINEAEGVVSLITQDSISTNADDLQSQASDVLCNSHHDPSQYQAEAGNGSPLDTISPPGCSISRDVCESSTHGPGAEQGHSQTASPGPSGSIKAKRKPGKTPKDDQGPISRKRTKKRTTEEMNWIESTRLLLDGKGCQISQEEIYDRFVDNCRPETAAFLMYLFFAIGSQDALIQLKRAIAYVRNGNLKITVSRFHTVSDTMRGLAQLNSASTAVQIMQRFFLMQLSEHRDDLVRKHKSETERSAKVKAREKRKKQQRHRAGETSENQVKGAQSLRRPRAEGLAWDDIMREGFPALAKNTAEYDAQLKMLKRRVTASQKCEQFKDEYATGIFGLIPGGIERE
ncbi:hypothetical protein BDV33DRAFT_66731 [Aspergillus novoparasiticus]|uniref:Uncharacterized protein n=1 Tax=Aspergillus novoparasiticus TaxID=986946 RepID=A0A5N6E7Q0_9EURO|nr:hypothetical protein BDV33DRAFT_66731 [Aspergillus novoparasiticus]